MRLFSSAISMINEHSIIEKNNLFHIYKADILRKTPDVLFNKVPVFEKIDAIDYVEHAANAVSPSIADKDGDFWYMHTHQEDNLLVIIGTRIVELYSKEHGKVETFEVTSSYIKHNGKLIHEGMTVFGWPKYVFHRVKSGAEGSRSLNFAIYDDNFDIKTNFNIYTLNTTNGIFEIAREGFKDQEFNEVNN